MRCQNPKSRAYPDYGGRGIRVCKQWRLFSNFIKDMGPRPSPHHSIDRIDVDGHYEPGNCRWATPQEQNRNRRCNTNLELNGAIKCLQAWADDLGIGAATFLQRLREWPRERALTEMRRGSRKGKRDHNGVCAMSRMLGPGLNMPTGWIRFNAARSGAQILTRIPRWPHQVLQ